MTNGVALKQILMGKTVKTAIITHVKPDADALGSSLGLAGYLQRKGHIVSVIAPSEYPDFLAWLPGAQNVIALSNQNPLAERKAKEVLNAADLIFCLDFATLNRINEMGEVVRASKAKKVLIDHHLEPEAFADFQLSDTSAASTAQLVYEFIVNMEGEGALGADVAQCLYAGLMTDTGSFRHSNTTAHEFEVAAKLAQHGAVPSVVAQKIYDTNTLSRLQFMGYVLNQKLVVLPEYRTAYVVLSQEELKQHSAQTGDTEGFVNFGLSVKDVRLSVLMYDRGNEIKLSFRSLGDFSVNDFARKHFQGGGHKNAAGGSSKLSLNETLQQFLNYLPAYRQSLWAP